VLVAAAILLLSIGLSTSPIISTHDANAQANRNMTGSMTGFSGSQNQTNFGPNITGTVALGPTIAKAISSQVHVSLSNASIIAEKAVGPIAQAAAVRIGVVHGFLVYMALVVDSSNNFHGIIVDAGNGKVLASTQMSITGMMMGPGMGMVHHGVMSKPYP
jgi:uncharacterized YccA/Bax inhibitor family protein